MFYKSSAFPANYRDETTALTEEMHANLRTQAIVIAEDMDVHAERMHANLRTQAIVIAEDMDVHAERMHANLRTQAVVIAEDIECTC